MGTTAEKLNAILETKAAIRNAIIDKGVDVEEDVVFADYPAKISAIQSGGSDDFLATRTLNGTNMHGLFYCFPGRSLDLSHLDTSNVKNMEEMFSQCDSLQSLTGLNNWNTSSVTSMTSMFYNCYSLISLDLSGFDTSNVTDMSGMFFICLNLKELDIRNFDMNKVTMSDMMFDMCNSLRILRLDNCDNATINKIITSTSLPTGTANGTTRIIYCKEENVAGLTAPDGWVFEYVD